MPATASISSAAMPPGRSSRNVPSSTLTMVDSTPTGVGPPSTIRSILPAEIGRDGAAPSWR